MRAVSKAIASVAALTMVAASTAAAAAPAPQAQPVAATTAPSPWMVLSTLGPTRAIALGGANAAAQPSDAPPPPPVMVEPGLHMSGEVLGFILWFGLIAAALSISGTSGGVPITTTPNSPG
jgi:hypothetical protein